jgi:hypothetical protein
MKPILTLLFAGLLAFLPLVNAWASDLQYGMIVLTADQVQTAVDIEAAIIQATDSGTRPGTVVLDGRNGDFTFQVAEGNDYTINIFVSNLTLKGRNGARVIGEGIYFDGMDLENITIENLELECATDCIVSWGDHRSVTIRKNILHAENSIGVQVAETEGWTIQDNVIWGGWTAVHVLLSSRVRILDNELGGFIPVILDRSDGNQVTANEAYGEWQGILLITPSRGNKVTANWIAGVEQSGISLEDGAVQNSIHGNRVQCAEDAEACLTVSADGDGWETNNISGNKP